MKHLEFKRKYLEFLLSGKKRSTIRKRAYVKPGEPVYVHCGGKIVGMARIRGVRKISLSDIDDQIARMEGFSDREELVRELDRYYDSKDLYLIEFDFEPFENPVEPHAMHYGNNDLVEVARKAMESDELGEEERRIIELFLKTGSIRKTAFRLGGISKRGVVREAIRKALKLVSENERIM